MRLAMWRGIASGRICRTVQLNLPLIPLSFAWLKALKPSPQSDYGSQLPKILNEAGFQYLSAVGGGVSSTADVASGPFRWIDVGAFYLEPQLGIVRESLYGSDQLLSLYDWQAALEKVVGEELTQGECYTLIFHPYLLGLDDKRYDVFSGFLDSLARSEGLWIAPCAQIAEWVRATSAQSRSK
jgi:hypothetical protein